MTQDAPLDQTAQSGFDAIDTQDFSAIGILKSLRGISQITADMTQGPIKGPYQLQIKALDEAIAALSRRVPASGGEAEPPGEAEQLRQIISDSAAAIGNGAFIEPCASIDFMRLLPDEIRAAMARASSPIVAAEGWQAVRELLEAFDRSDVPTHYHSHPNLCDAFARARKLLAAAPSIPEGKAEPVALGPDGKEWAKTEAGYAHVESVRASAVEGPAGLVWYGHAVREAFVAGAEWQESRRG